MDKGTVLRFFDQKGFGFIQPESGGKDLFVHINEVEGGQLQSGDVVEFEVTEGRKGTQASSVKVVYIILASNFGHYSLSIVTHHSFHLMIILISMTRCVKNL